MFKATIAIAILGFASSASAISCYSGITYDGSNPSTTATGCWSCTKSVTRYTYGSSTTTRTYYTGSGCTGYSSVSASAATGVAGAAAAVGAALGAAATSFGSGLTDVSFGATCSAYTVSNPTAAISNALNTVNTGFSNLVNAAVGASVSCSGSSTTHSCGSGSDSGSYSTCVCCGDNCNSSGFKCGAASISASMMTMLVFALVAYFMRQ